MRRRISCAMATLVLLGAFGCSDNGTSPTRSNTAPVLPAASTMQIDTSFPGGQAVVNRVPASGADARASVRSTSANQENWINAYTRVTYVALTTYDHLQEPVAAFAAAIHSRPQKQEDGSFLWTYIYVDPTTQIEYQIFLYGTPADGSTQWRMEVSSNDPSQPLDHFVWFTGESAALGRSGYWQFYEPVDATTGVQTARIDWTRQLGNRELLITVNGETRPDFGASLDFHATLTQSTIDYVDASQVASNITWYPDGSGSLTVPDYNGGATACWDTTQHNVTCP